MTRVAAVLLAAGGSSRMGTPKQLLRLAGESLVVRAAGCALASRCDPVIAVVGGAADRVRQELGDLPVLVAEAVDWEEGLAASIRCGVAAARAERPPVDAAVLLLADQTQVTAAHLDALIGSFESGAADRVATAYAGTVGAPALFGRAHFDALGSLHGDRGARDWLRERADGLATVPFPDASFDVDTPEDFEAADR